MPESAVLTRDLCEEALSLIRGSLDQCLTTEGLYGTDMGELVVLNPTCLYESVHDGGPSNVAFANEVVCWRKSFGKRQDWPFPFDEFALAKAYVSFKHRLPADVVVSQFPYLLEPGMAKYGGSAVDPVGGLVVAFSGARVHHDKQISEMMLDAIRAVCTARMEELNELEGLHFLERADR